jgi:DNA polymerase III epsilon subunit-like protein
MNDKSWILLDTETTGFAAPVFVVELAAQRMRGWDPEDEPFRELLNQNQDIRDETSRVNGYTREILERDGEPPAHVYREFAKYAQALPLVSFNLEYDMDEVLKPEWQRLGVASIGAPGFCALRLAQRLLDPVPAGNCKLQTLRQYYRLPERGAHTALGDVQTVADLFSHVLRPIAQHRGMDTWEKLAAYAAEEWYPSRISFGKHKGRLFQEARKDVELRRWLDWLSGSSNARSAKMGLWYLRQLEINAQPQGDGIPFVSPHFQTTGKGAGKAGAVEFAALVIYINPVLAELRELIATARARLAALETDYTKEKSRVDAMQAILFRSLREYYQKRDGLRLVVEYRKKFLDSMVRGDDEETKETEENYERAKAQADKDYEETAAAVAEKKQLTEEEEAELTRLWKKLVKLYHPDRFAHEPDKLETYHKLTSAINRAKDAADMKTLREIAEDPHGFILRQGWASLDFTDEIALVQLRKLHETLQLEIITVIESLNQLRESPDYELCRISEQKPSVLDELAADRKKLLEKESADLQAQANRLAEEIKELHGSEPSGIG